MLENRRIKDLALQAGFVLCGVARSRPLPESERRFRAWLEAGRSAGLGYLHRNLDKRFDPSRLVEGARTVVVCAAAYKNGVSEGYPSGSRAKIASYACTADYHATLKGMLRRMFDELKREHPSLSGRIFVDSAPILEKRFAVEAGLGWTGRQSLLVTPQFGTFVLLGELVLTMDADRYDEPLGDGAGCGECRRCIDACPTGAVLPSRTIDASRCISCATVESNFREGESSVANVDLHGWIFGCDECQSCCPYNRRAPRHRSPAFEPLFDPREISPDEWQSMTDAEFADRFGSTPLMRSGPDVIKRNL